MTDLGALLVRVVRLLEGAGIPYMVIGGFANLIWGEPRATVDLDITVDVGTRELTSFVGLVLELGDPVPDDPVSFAERSRVLPVSTPGGAGIDFVIATLPFELQAIERARSVSVEGVDVMFCAPEDLIVHKVVSERVRDHEDIVGVMKRQGSALDIERLDRLVAAIAAELGETEILERFAEAKRLANVGTS